MDYKIEKEMSATFVTPGGHTAIERRKGERRNDYRAAWGRVLMGTDNRKEWADRRRAAQHYGDQARIARLETALKVIIALDEPASAMIARAALKENI